MNDNLPSGWSIAESADVCESIQSGSTPPAAEMFPLSGDVQFLKVYNLTFDGTLNFAKDPVFIARDTHEGRLRRSRALPGDVLMNIVGPPLGKVSILPPSLPEANFNQAIVGFRANEALDHRFLSYFLLSPEFLTIANRTSQATSGQFNLSVNWCRAIDVPIPPLKEQKRIVAKIEALQSRSKAAREALEEIPSLIEKFRQSVLAAAFRGDLTKEWREKNKDKCEPASELLKRIRVERRKKWEEAELEKMRKKGKVPTDDKWKAKYKEPEPVDTEGLPELPEGWCWASLAELMIRIVDGTHHTPRYVDAGVPFLSVKDIRDGKVYFDNCKYITTEDHVQLIERCNPEEGDILVTKSGTIGRVALVGDNSQFSLFVSVALLKPASKLATSAWTARAFEAWVNTINLQSDIKGSAVKNLHLEDFARIRVPIAPQAEQEEVVKLLKDAFASSRQTSTQVSALPEFLGQLDQSILAKAFRGELVPQDPNDEPASVLLERIKKEREEQGKKNGKAKAVKGAKRGKKVKEVV